LWMVMESKCRVGRASAAAGGRAKRRRVPPAILEYIAL
jgi:hypothetical protein